MYKRISKGIHLDHRKVGKDRIGWFACMRHPSSGIELEPLGKWHRLDGAYSTLEQVIKGVNIPICLVNAERRVSSQGSLCSKLIPRERSWTSLGMYASRPLSKLVGCIRNRRTACALDICHCYSTVLIPKERGLSRVARRRRHHCAVKLLLEYAMLND